MARWWRWSTGPGKRRKVIGLGLPLLLAIILLNALTPARPDADGSGAGATPTSAAADASASPTATASSALTATPLASGASSTGVPEGEPAVVERVVDGDTVVLEDGRRLRLIGIDTPETVAPGEPVGCFGPEASARTKSLVEGRAVTLEKDVSETDRYDRILRYVYLPDGRMLNEVLVAEGYARAIRYPPDVKYAGRFESAEATARDARLGLWGAGCPERGANRHRHADRDSLRRADRRRVPRGLHRTAAGLPDQGQHQLQQRGDLSRAGAVELRRDDHRPGKGRALVLHGG